ncbi:MAG: hypothetical protein ABH828_06525 [archaeon]
MSEPEYKFDSMREYEQDAKSFQEEIFRKNSIFKGLVKILSTSDNQKTSDIINLTKESVNTWVREIAIEGVGVQSLRTDIPVNALSLIYICTRHANQDEMTDDYKNLGDKVIGEKLDDLRGDEGVQKILFFPTFEIEGKKYIFKGEQRFLKGIFSTIVFYENLPKDISYFANEVETFAKAYNNHNSVAKLSEQKWFVIAEENKHTGVVSRDGFLMFHANKGKVSTTGFVNDSDYDHNKLISHGTVIHEGGGELIYNPSVSTQVRMHIESLIQN